jgi:hypothetical protein
MCGVGVGVGVGGGHGRRAPRKRNAMLVEVTEILFGLRGRGGAQPFVVFHTKLPCCNCY